MKKNNSCRYYHSLPFLKISKKSIQLSLENLVDKKGGKNNCKKVRNKERKNTAIVIRSWVGNGRLKFKTTQTL